MSDCRLGVLTEIMMEQRQDMFQNSDLKGNAPFEGISPHVCAGTAAEQTQQSLHSTESFEDLDLSHADAGDEHEAGQPQAASILLSWQPEGVPLPCKGSCLVLAMLYLSTMKGDFLTVGTAHTRVTEICSGSLAHSLPFQPFQPLMGLAMLLTPGMYSCRHRWQGHNAPCSRTVMCPLRRHGY